MRRSDQEILEKIKHYKKIQSIDSAWTGRGDIDEYVYKKIALEWTLGLREEI